MRERVAFVHAQGAHVEPEALKIQPAGLLGPSADAVRQDRFTVPVEELPVELASLLRGYHALHLRWTSPQQYSTLEPFSSRQSPGLHVLATPAADRSHHLRKLCEFLQVLGPLDCMIPEAFTSAGTLQPGVAESFSFYQAVEDLSSLVASGTKDICSEADPICQSRLRSLYIVATLDFSFDSADQAVTISALWPLWERALTVPRSEKRRTEVGIFTKGDPPNISPFEVGLGGLLTVLGEQDKPSPALFAFPSRNRLSDASFSSEFLSPTGLHPTLLLRLSTSKPPLQDSDCVPYAFLTLPKTVFADRYQLEDKLFLASKNLSAARYTTLPVDLEAPEYTTKTWGSSVLLELAPPADGEDHPWTVQVPLHLRYLRPAASAYAQVEVPFPAVFWACDETSEADFSTNPFDRLHLGYDGLFSRKTSFWHAEPKPVNGSRLMSSVSVPVLEEEAATWIRLGTTTVVGLGFAWVVWKLLSAYMAPSMADRGERDGRRRKKET
ncbi:hypothetical protein CDD83_9550 [Cordyceps sp. RAO-2017]|nr:hypothetical protein CDD83_9550 [Cordyceps sp. RAO-2017]